MHDSYMFQNRFGTGMGNYGISGRFGQNTFDMPSSAFYRQFHEMKAEMPSDVLELFKANEVGFLKAPVKPKCRPLDPISSMKINLMEMFQIPNLQLMDEQKTQTKQQKQARIKQEKKQLNENRIRAEIQEWNPFQDDKINNTDPEKTLLVARLNYNTTQKQLKFQFEKYGIIKSVRIVRNLNGKSRGYGFVEFDNKEDFIAAYKQANHRKIDGRRVLVDYEKGRTILNWRPRRFGKGAGFTRMTKQQLEKFQQQQKEKKENETKDKKKSHAQRQSSRSPRRQRRRDDYNDDRQRDRRRKSSRDRKEKKGR